MNDTVLTPMQTRMPQGSYQEDGGLSSCLPIIAPTQLQIRLFGKKKTQPSQAPQDKPEEKTKIKATPIGKYELIDDKVAFFRLSGTFKKGWVILAEIPLSEISAVESMGNAIHIMWNGAAYDYVHTAKTESLRGLQEQILAYMTRKREAEEKNRKTAALKAELASARNASIQAIDTCFDVLMALNQKRPDWSQIQTIAQKLEGSISFGGNTLTPQNIDATKIPLSIKSHVPKDIAKNVIDTLKSIYAYFETLKSIDGLVENTALVGNSKAAILAYYVVNDVLLARVTGQKVEDKELSALENVVRELADKSVIKLSIDELRAALENVDSGELGVSDVRAMLRAAD